jgi:hypothetical protein
VNRDDRAAGPLGRELDAGERVDEAEQVAHQRMDGFRQQKSSAYGR